MRGPGSCWLWRTFLLVRTTTIKCLCRITIPAQDLETVGVSILPEPMAYPALENPGLFSVYIAVVIDMIYAQEFCFRLAAAGAFSAIRAQGRQSFSVMPGTVVDFDLFWMINPPLAANFILRFSIPRIPSFVGGLVPFLFGYALSCQASPHGNPMTVE